MVMLVSFLRVYFLSASWSKLAAVPSSVAASSFWGGNIGASDSGPQKRAAWPRGYHLCRCSSLAKVPAPAFVRVTMCPKMTGDSCNLATEPAGWALWLVTQSVLDCCSWSRGRHQASATGTPPPFCTFSLFRWWPRACRHLCHCGPCLEICFLQK